MSIRQIKISENKLKSFKGRINRISNFKTPAKVNNDLTIQNPYQDFESQLSLEDVDQDLHSAELTPNQVV